MNCYERIKSMSIEEMADFLSYIDDDCLMCKEEADARCNGYCKAMHKEWLEQDSSAINELLYE